MKIGIAGPINLAMLNFDSKGQKLPQAGSFPIIALIINELLDKGYEIVAYTNSYDIKEPIVLEDKRLKICIGRRESHAGRDFFKSERQDLLFLIKQNPADIINAQWSYEFAWAALDSGIPTVVTLRDHATTILKYQFGVYRLMRWVMNYIVLKKAKYLATNSGYLLNLLSTKQQNKARISNNFYNINLEKHFTSSSEKGDYILSIANGFGKRKNVENALYAFSIVKKQLPALQYHLIGTGMEEQGPAYQFAKKHQLLDGLVFIGHKPFNMIIEEISKAQVFLHPSREESFGNVVLESMVIGTPVIGGDKSGNVPYLLDQGKVGILCDINSPKKIAKAILDITSNFELATKLRIEAHKFAKENFASEKVISNLIHYYEDILNKRI